eukprot:scaffold107042_cov102-Phaeocystis_antarctica.AAC.2
MQCVHVLCMYRVEDMIWAAQRACRPRSFASCQVRPRQATCPAARNAPVHAQRTYSAHAVRMQCACAVRMQCSAHRGARRAAR